MDQPNDNFSDRDIRPRPDPTILTTQQTLREVAMMRELLETRLVALERLLLLNREEMQGVPRQITDQVHQLQMLHEEKFRSVAIQFSERDTRTEQTSRDSKVAVDAALQAAKEAVEKQNQSSALAIAKSEMATIKQMDQIGVLLNSTVTSINDKIDDLKERLTAMDGRITSSEGRNKGSMDNWFYLFSFIGTAAAVATAIGAIVILFISKGH